VGVLVVLFDIDLPERVAAFLEFSVALMLIGLGLSALMRVMLGWRDDDEVARLYAGCRALVFPPREDFGIAPLEAMAAGRPVLAFGEGGATETVVPPGGAEPPTGLFFARQTAEDVIDAMERFEADAGRFEPKLLRRRAEAFDRPIFKERIERYVRARLAEHGRC
jgi:glycosyltransferase involved in cell wall biosynthesis